jgi:hypothetical protein
MRAAITPRLQAISSVCAYTLDGDCLNLTLARNRGHLHLAADGAVGDAQVANRPRWLRVIVPRRVFV